MKLGKKLHYIELSVIRSVVIFIICTKYIVFIVNIYKGPNIGEFFSWLIICIWNSVWFYCGLKKQS
jgi:hypothetical protein